MACASCAQRRAILNKMMTKAMPLKEGARQVGQTIRNDVIKLRGVAQRIKFK